MEPGMRMEGAGGLARRQRHEQPRAPEAARPKPPAEDVTDVALEKEWFAAGQRLSGAYYALSDEDKMKIPLSLRQALENFAERHQ